MLTTLVNNSQHLPILTPSLRGDKTARITIVVDTSGSIGPDFRQRALTDSPLVAAAEAFKVHQLAGGGGTNMVAGIEAALEQSPRPDSILVLTDGFTPYPPHRYDLPVIFGIFDLDNSVRRKPPNPPWGGRIRWWLLRAQTKLSYFQAVDDVSGLIWAEAQTCATKLFELHQCSLPLVAATALKRQFGLRPLLIGFRKVV